MSSPAQSASYSSNVINFSENKDIDVDPIEDLNKQINDLQKRLLASEAKNQEQLETIMQMREALEEADNREAEHNRTMGEERGIFYRLRNRVTLATGLSGTALAVATVLLVVAIVILVV